MQMPHVVSFLALVGLAAVASAVAAEGPHVLDAQALFAGHEATKVLPKDGALVLDTRNWRKGNQGVIVTDVIDLAGDGLLAAPAEVKDLVVEVDHAVPEGAAVTLAVRTGTTFFQHEGTWTEWEPVTGPIQPKGRYAQVRLTLAAADPAVPPSVKRLSLKCRVNRGPASAGTVAVVEDKVQQIVTSPLVFGYERPDQPDLAWLRKTFNLDTVIAGKASEFEQLKALMHWTATRKNDRHQGWYSGAYPWHIRKVMSEKDGGTVFGHCMSYCEVLITAAGSLGWQGRHWAILGFRETSHEVPEIWVNELGKWVFFDPSLDTYYADPKTGEPMSLLEMHNTFVDALLREGETLQWSGIRGNPTYSERIQALRGKHPITCISGDYAYGEPTKWDWQWRHGYLTAGWMQLTTRNNWHSQPNPPCRSFQNGPTGYCGFPVYVDAKTPIPSSGTRNWLTRRRDLWWTLNQAAFRLTRTGANTLAVECGNSQPFFKRYLVRKAAEAARYSSAWQPADREVIWTLTPGENRLEVVPEDEFGRRGIASAAVIRYTPAAD